MTSYKPFKPLTLKPIQFSLTEGTNIPAPPPEPTPQRAPSSKKQSAPGTTGNPLLNGDATAPLQQIPEDGTSDSRPFSPPSPQKRPSALRKLLSFRSLRRLNSTPNTRDISSSRMGNYNDYDPVNDRQTATSMSTYTIGQTRPAASPSAPGASRPMSPFGIKSYSTGTVPQSRPGTSMGRYLQRKRSSGWFNTAPGSDAGYGVDENGMMIRENSVGRAAGVHGSMRSRGPPPPTIPEFASLGAILDGGKLGDEDMFRNIKGE